MAARTRRAPSQRASIGVDLTGPFFRKDPEKTIFENVQKMMVGIADEGAKAARVGFLSGASQRALIRELGDRVADHVVGRTVSLTGKRWTAAAVVQVSNKGYSEREGTSLMAAGSYVERRTRTIASVTRQLRNARAVLRANLTEGIE